MWCIGEWVGGRGAGGWAGWGGGDRVIVVVVFAETVHGARSLFIRLGKKKRKFNKRKKKGRGLAPTNSCLGGNSERYTLGASVTVKQQGADF